jgi:predicted site-specific integrase-resolvase
VINTAADGKEDLLQDFIAIITPFCARLCRPTRRHRGVTDAARLIAEIAREKDSDV